MRELIRVGLALVLATLAIALVACSERSGDRPDGVEEVADGQVADDVPERATFRADCEGELRPAKKREAAFHIYAGAVTFISGRRNHRSEADRGLFRRELTPGEDKTGGRARWRALKQLIEISPPVEATVTVARGDRSSFLLQYDPERRRPGIAYFRSDGDPRVVFGACAGASPDDATGFVGGFLARRPGCYRVTVTSEVDPEPLTRVVNVAMGQGGCPGEDE